MRQDGRLEVCVCECMCVCVCMCARVCVRECAKHISGAAEQTNKDSVWKTERFINKEKDPLFRRVLITCTRDEKGMKKEMKKESAPIVCPMCLAEENSVWGNTLHCFVILVFMS